MSRPTHPQIEFAKRHLVGELSTFNASSAIFRLENLLEEIKDVQQHLQPILDDRWAPAFFEFTAYYRVAFVTCLEWHGKSRLYDLFTFEPTTIKANHIKQAVTDQKLAQMVSEGLTIPQLLAGSNSISTIEAYSDAIGRVFEFIGAPDDAFTKIMSQKNGDSATNGETLKDLFVGRNNLVHEIGIQNIGHRNIRDFDSFEEAWERGHQILKILRSLEGVITDYAPPLFPNRLGEDGYPVNEEDLLRQVIEASENKIQGHLELDPDDIAPLSVEAWLEERQRSAAYIDAQIELIDSLALAGWNYYDVRPFLRKSLLKQRIQFLDQLLQQVG